MNHKKCGEIGEGIAIGELSKIEVDVAIPLSDNYPYDLILIYKNRFYRAQIKSSSTVSPSKSDSIAFSLRKNNWYNRTIKKYTSFDIDIMLLCDIGRGAIYALGKEDFENRRGFTIRYDKPLNNVKGYHYAHDYVLSTSRLDKILIGL